MRPGRLAGVSPTADLQVRAVVLAAMVAAAGRLPAVGMRLRLGAEADPAARLPQLSPKGHARGGLADR